MPSDPTLKSRCRAPCNPRAGGAGEVEDVIDFAAVEGLVDIELPKLEARIRCADVRDWSRVR